MCPTYVLYIMHHITYAKLPKLRRHRGKHRPDRLIHNLIFQDLFNFGSPDKHIRVKSVLRSHLRDNEKVVF